MVSGVFTVSGPVIASIAGPGIVISYLIGGVAASLSALCYAEMGARIPITGSGYLYVSLSAGELWGFLAGWNMLLEYMMTIAAMSRALTQSIETVIGGRNGSYALDSASFTLGGEKTDLLAAIIIIVFGVLVASGARMTSFVNNTCNMLAMALILACTIYAFTVANLDNWFGSSNGVSTFLPFGLGGAIEGTAIVYFGYIGFESITVSGEETVNPKSSVPVAIALALSMATLLFVLTSMALTLYVPYHDIFPGSAMIVAFMEHGSHAWGIVAAVAALLSIGTNVIMASFSLPRIMYAMASDGLLFGRLAEINSRTKSPLNSIIASTVVSALLAFFFSMDTLVKAVSIGTLYCYAMVAVGAILLRFQSMDYILEKQEDLVGTGTNKEQQTTPDECRVPQHNVSGTEKDLGESGLIIPGRRKAWVEKCCLRFWPDVGITTTVVAILVSISVMSFFVMLAFRLNVLGIWWNIAVIVVCAPLILLCVAHLCLYQQNEGTADSFRVCLHIFICTLKISRDIAPRDTCLWFYHHL